MPPAGNWVCFACSIPPLFVLSHSLPTVNTIGKLALFWRFSTGAGRVNETTRRFRFWTPRRWVRVAMLTRRVSMESPAATGHPSEKLPSERTLRDILNRMNYRLKRIQKGKPLKKTKETDAIFANVKEVQQQARSDPETLEISMDTKAKIALGDYARGGKTRTDGNGQVTKGWDHDPPAKEKQVPFGILMVVAGALTLLFGSRETSRRLGRCLADVVAACSGILRTHPTPGDLSGQRSKELGSADPVSQADGAVCRLVGVGVTLGVRSALPQQVQSDRTLLVGPGEEMERCDPELPEGDSAMRCG